MNVAVPGSPALAAKYGLILPAVNVPGVKVTEAATGPFVIPLIPPEAFPLPLLAAIHGV